MKFATYRSPLGALQPSGSYLKIERARKNHKIGRAIKKVRKIENHKIGRKKKNRDKKIGREASKRKI